MIREVDLVSYLPPFMQQYKEPVAALKAEDPEFLIVWKAVDKILYNHFISTCDEYGIGRYEKMLGIYPTSEDTLESRRSRVQSKWFNTIPYTMRVFIQKLTVLCNDTDFTLSHNFTEGYTLNIDTDLELFGQVEELEYIITTMIPENIVVISQNNIPCNAWGSVFMGGGICFVNDFNITNDFRETFSVESNVAFGGGIVQTDMMTVTDAGRETVTAKGDALFSGGSVHTDMIQLTDGFNDVIRADADAAIGTGAVMVDIIEIKN
jgi:hypothetical protein